MMKLSVGIWIVLSIASSTSLILLLKQVGKHVHCKYTTTLSTLHFLATWIFLEILACTGKIKKNNAIPFIKKIKLAFLVVGSIVFMNFNLGANSIGFYQMSKLVCVPYMVFHKMVFKHQKFSTFELVSLFVLISGVALFSISDIEINLIGSIYAAAAIFCTVFNQMFTEEYQRDFQISGTELQLLIAPPEFALGCIASVLFEATGENGFLSASISMNDCLLMLSTCIFAVGVNVSTFNLIGKTSSITYQVVGHFKTILLLVFGYIFFPSNWESTFQMIKAYAGIVIALTGVILYNRAKSVAKKPSDTQTLLANANDIDGNENKKDNL